MGYLLLGTSGGIVAGIVVLASSGSVIVAFLTYALGGAVLTVVAAAVSLVCAPFRKRAQAFWAARAQS
jgi:hypothetical protein